jgi:NAD(P)-dependent dehydrogenase (short-subunit alcohol dehydrogenase family)
MSERYRQDSAAAVTGGARGIGFAVAERLARAGVRVALWDLDRARAESSAKELATAGKVIAITVDITDEAAVARALAETTERIGKLDIFVNNAGIAGASKTLWDYMPEEWRQVFRINVEGMYLCCRAVVPQMIERGYGRIVNVASIAGKEGNPNAAAYSASKAAVMGLTKSLAKELATKGVIVNSVTPAAVKTEIFEQISQAHIDYMLSKIPMGRFGKVEEMAAMICWLASEDCSFTTGAVFDLSGGRATY